MRADMGMIERWRWCALLVLEAIEVRLFQKLDGDRAAQPRIRGFIDFAHPARADQRQDFVRPNACAARERHRMERFYLSGTGLTDEASGPRGAGDVIPE